MISNLQSYGTVAATGTTAADAALITSHITIVTGADSTKGVKLPLLNPYINEVRILNDTLTEAVRVYPFSGNTIKGYSTDVFFLMGKQYNLFTRINLTDWAIADPSYGYLSQSVSAAGTTQGDATPLNLGPVNYIINGATGANGVLLPAVPGTASGIIKYVVNVLGNTFNLYPYTGQALGGLGVNNPLLVAGYRQVILRAWVGGSPWSYT